MNATVNIVCYKQKTLKNKVENPFKKFKVSKFNTKTQKRAISKDEIKKIITLDLSSQRSYMKWKVKICLFSVICVAG